VLRDPSTPDPFPNLHSPIKLFIVCAACSDAWLPLLQLPVPQDLCHKVLLTHSPMLKLFIVCAACSDAWLALLQLPVPQDLYHKVLLIQMMLITVC